MDATTLQRVKWLLPNADQSTEEDALLAAMITSVSAHVETFLRRSLESKSRTEDQDVRQSQLRFFLPAYPIAASPALVLYNDWNRVFDAATIVDASLYTIDTERGLVLMDKAYLTTGLRVARFTWTGGLATTPELLAAAYPTITMAASYQVANEFRRRKRLDVSSVNLGGAGIAIAGEIKLLDHVTAMLQPYRREGILR